MDEQLEKIWLQSVHSDGSSLFVSSLQPNIGEKVCIRIRMLPNPSLKYVYLKYIANGEQKRIEMQRENLRLEGLQYYSAEVEMTQKVLRYQFLLATEDQLYTYTQRGISTFIQDEHCDFSLLSDYVQPEWVQDAVFYQIFPERFCNGCEDNDVKDGEFESEGFPAQHCDWNSFPQRYEYTHCLDFFGGDLQGIRQKIPYLKSLGVTAIYLNPIFTAPSVHKYDAEDFESIDPHFGGDEALAELTAALHENGMKLIMDISINHTGTTHRWYRSEETRTKYYRRNPDGSQRFWHNVPTMPVLDYASDELRDKLYRKPDSVLRKWLKAPYSIDGWRFDVADVMARYETDTYDTEVWREIRQAIREENPQAYILAEDWTECSERLQGDQWDSAMNYYGFSRILRPFLGLPDNYLAWTPELAPFTAHLSAEDFRRRMEDFLAPIPFALQQCQFNLLNSHDVPRVHNHPQVNPEELRGAIICMFTAPGTPSVYYGDEAHIDGWIDSMEGCRFPMPWDSGFESSGTFQLYAALGHLRREHEVLRRGSFRFLYAEKDVIVWARFNEKETILTIMSTAAEDREILLPLQALGITKEHFCQELLGHKLLPVFKDDGSSILQIKAHQAHLLMFRKES